MSSSLYIRQIIRVLVSSKQNMKRKNDSQSEESVFEVSGQK